MEAKEVVGGYTEVEPSDLNEARPLVVGAVERRDGARIPR